MSVSDFMKKRSALSIALVLYVGLAVLLFPLFQYKLYPDTISYISIAKRYLHGNFHLAINGYFSPLYSWLLMPLLWIGIPSLPAIKILSVLIGFANMVLTYRLSYRFEISESIRRVLIFTLIIPMVYFVYAFSTPDLLLAGVLLIYFIVIFDKAYIERRSKGMISGFLGGVAYLSKSYAFPFFLLHFPLVNLLHYFRCDDRSLKKNLLNNFTSGMLAFLIVSGSWIALISNKYHEFTIGTSVKYAYSYMKPNSEGHPIGAKGFFKPIDKSAVSIWEDPTKTADGSWSPLQSIQYLKYQLKLCIFFAAKVLHNFGRFSTLSYAFIVIYVLLLAPFSKRTLSDTRLIPLVTLFAYTSGFFLVVPVERYLWVDEFLFLLMGGYVLTHLFTTDFFNPGRKRIMLFFFTISFIIYPVKNLILHQNEGADIYKLSRVLTKKYHISGNIASHSHYKRPLFLSFFMNTRYFGSAKDNIPCDDLIHELQKYGIDYYFVWSKKKNDFTFFKENYDCIYQFPEITGGDIPYLRIFQIGAAATDNPNP